MVGRTVPSATDIADVRRENACGYWVHRLAARGAAQQAKLTRRRALPRFEGTLHTLCTPQITHAAHVTAKLRDVTRPT